MMAGDGRERSAQDGARRRCRRIPRISPTSIRRLRGVTGAAAATAAATCGVAEGLERRLPLSAGLNAQRRSRQCGTGTGATQVGHRSRARTATGKAPKRATAVSGAQGWDRHGLLLLLLLLLPVDKRCARPLRRRRLLRPPAVRRGVQQAGRARRLMDAGAVDGSLVAERDGTRRQQQLTGRLLGGRTWCPVVQHPACRRRARTRGVIVACIRLAVRLGVAEAARVRGRRRPASAVERERGAAVRPP